MPLQDGIYSGSGKSPPGFWTLMLLRATRNNAAAVAANLSQLWPLWQGLSQGIVPDLAPVRVPVAASADARLQTLLGFHRSAFRLAGAPRQAPAALLAYDFAGPARGGPLAVPSDEDRARDANHHADSGISYTAGLAAADYASLTNVHFAVQFTADSPLAVQRAVVETWKWLNDAGGNAALAIAGVYGGEKRDDRRSWIDFDDGMSNIPSAERPGVITISVAGGPGEVWTVDGTYFAFVRLGIDLAVWRGLSGDPGSRRARQERFVGRDKLTGCPLIAFTASTDQAGTAIPGCPGGAPSAWDTDAFRDPGPLENGNTFAAVTHMRRANRRLSANNARVPPEDATSLRIYRQSYPFLESAPRAPTTFEAQAGFRVGLNFVSFQNTPARLIKLLTKLDWLGRMNFGGATRNVQEPILTAYAAGMFFVPRQRVGNEPFPGASVLRAPVPAPP